VRATPALSWVWIFIFELVEGGLENSHSASNLQQIECYLQAENLFTLSFKYTDEALSWNLARDIEQAQKEDVPSLAWIWEFRKHNTV